MSRLPWLLGLALVGCVEDREGRPPLPQHQTTAEKAATPAGNLGPPADPGPAANPGPGSGMGRVRGRVIDNLADPVGGAEVLLALVSGHARLMTPTPTPDQAPVRTHTDALGRFTLDHSPTAGLLLVVHHPYFEPCLSRRDLRLGAGVTLDLGDLTLEPAPGVVVEVRARESQRALAGARVQLWPALEDATLPAVVLDMYRRETYTTAAGHAALYAVGKGAYVLRVEATGRATVETRHQQPATVARALRIRVQLQKGLSLHGRVLSAGKPVSGARIACMPEGGRLSHATSTDARGEFTIPGLLPQSYWLIVTHDEHGPLMQEAVVPGSGPCTLELPVGHAVEGQVLDRVSRRPVAGARVVVHVGTGWPALRHGCLQQPTAVTDARGHFRVGGLPAGIVSVAAESQGFFSTEHGPIQPDSGPVTLLLHAGSRVTGKVQDPTGQPVRDALVDVIPKQQPGTANRRLLAGVAASHRHLPRTTTGSSGRFDLGGLPPGQYRLLVQKNGLPPFLSKAFGASPRGSEDLGTLRLPAGGHIQGVASYRSGRPAAGATVCLDPLSGLHPETAGAKAVCDDQGRFALGPVAPGQYHMFYYSPGKETAAEAAASRHNTLVRVRVSNRQTLTRNLHPRSR